MTEYAQKKHAPFWRIKCNACGNEQVVYSCATRKIKCNVCSAILAESTAHRIKLTEAKKLRDY
ncbi:MAG: 30S ribosomal protein S27e [Candidatus Diapherotrites archaeon]|nr:30S ribosomal protein S27e [Candidatus Diapherotrites archaeon]